MKLFTIMKDGGKDSNVTGYFLAEIKSLFSIVLLKFADGSRDAYHSHAFNSVSWVLKGKLVEQLLLNKWGKHEVYHTNIYQPSLISVLTKRDTFHKVTSVGTTWALSFRGPWSPTWKEYLPKEDKDLELTHGRKVINEHA